MAISEARLQLLLPKQLKRAVQHHSGQLGLSIGEYIRRLIEADLRQAQREHRAVEFPFGEKPIRTGRTHGSVDHDRV